MLRAEFRKAHSTRALPALWAAAVLVTAVGAFTTTSSADGPNLTGPIHEQQFYLLNSINLSLFALVLGVRSFTDEFRHGTIGWTLLSLRDRWRLVLAKVLTAAGHGALMAITAHAVAVGIAIWVAGAKGGALEFAFEDLSAAAGLTAAVALWAALGVAVGAVVRHQVAAIAMVIVWVLAIENLGASLLGGAGRYLPGQAGYALAQANAATDLAALGLGAAVLGATVALSIAIAAVTLDRRPTLLLS